MLKAEGSKDVRKQGRDQTRCGGVERKKKLICRQIRRSNQSILKEINSEYSLEGLMLKLKFQYFGHLM